MWTRTCFVLVTLILLLGSTSDRTSRLVGDEPKPSTTIRADEIGHSVNVLGKLGSPLSSVVTVSGYWVELTAGPEKPGSYLWFRVVEVGGKLLGKPVEFCIFDVKVVEKDGKTIEPAKGERWVLRAYETWPDYGHPSDFVQELGQQVVAPVPKGPTRLIGILKQRMAK